MRFVLFMIAAVLTIGFVGWKLCVPSAGAPTAAPGLMKQWDDQVYGLDSDEVLRLVPPPFVAGRQNRLFPSSAAQAMALKQHGQLVLDVRPLEVSTWGNSSRNGTVASAFMWCTHLDRLDLDPAHSQIPSDLGAIRRWLAVQLVHSSSHYNSWNSL